MTPDRAINDLGTIKYLLDATESPQRFLTDAHKSAFPVFLISYNFIYGIYNQLSETFSI